MNNTYLVAIAKKEGISLATVRHEYNEIRFLQAMMDDPLLSTNLIFKGGTALRLVYGLDRYSEDLDFDCSNDGVASDVLLEKLQACAHALSLEVTDAWVKRQTVLLEVRHPEWKRRLKVEVSLLPKTHGKIALQSILSPLYPSTILVRTYPLPQLLAGKMVAILTRKHPAPRDLYDLFWLLSRRTEEDEEYFLSVYGEEITREQRYEKLITAVGQYSDVQIASELGAMLKPEIRDWVRSHLKERTEELLRLRLGDGE
jgi:predicted nucleotidyltransferase component of viral defense system